jgi:hypothetical protein
MSGITRYGIVSGCIGDPCAAIANEFAPTGEVSGQAVMEVGAASAAIVVRGLPVNRE